MVNNDQQQEKPQDFELMELLFSKIDSSTSDAADSLDKSFEARYQSLVDQIQSYLHSSEKPGFFPHRFLGSFSSVLDTKLNDKLGIKKLHFRFEGARTLKVVAETESKTHVFIFTEEIEAQHSYSPQTRTKNFEFTTGEWKNVMGRDYTPLDERKLQIDVIKILKDKYELVKSKPKSDKDVKSKKLYLYVKKDGVLEYVAKDIHGGTKAIQINRDELKGNNAFKDKFFDEIKQFLRSGKDLSDDVRKELSRITSAKGYTLKSDGEDEKINIKVESKKKIVDQPIEPTVKFQKVTKKMGKSIYLEDYIEKLVNSDTRQAKENLEDILNYIKKVHANLDLQDNVYGIKAREADQHGFVAGVFDNFRYRDNTKLYLEQFAGGGYADIVLLVRGPNRAVDSVPILIELKAGTEGQVDPSDALRQAEDYIKGFRPNKMRILTNADNAIAVGLNLDNAEPFKTEVKPIKQPSSPLMEKILTDIRDWDGSQHTRAQLEEQIKSALSSEYHTFPANKETKDHYYFSRDILGQSILINKIGQDQGNVKKYIYSYGEYPLDWSGGTEYTLSKSPVTTLIFVQGNEGQEKTAFIFHIRESNTKEFYADKKIPVLNIPGIGEVKNVIETKMSLRKYETGLSFEELFEIEQISKYKPSGADQQFAGSFLKIPNSDELKVKFDQAITSQHASDGEVSLQAYKVLLTEVADAVYPIKDLITNEARLQAVLNGLLSSYSDLKLQETSAKTVIIPEFQVGAGGRVDMVIQGIGPSPQGTKEYTPIALEFKLIDKNLDEKGMKKEVDKLTKEQNVRYAKGAALKAITDSDKMFFMGVVVNVKAKDKNSLILTSDEFVPALVVHSSIDIAKRKHLEGIQEVTQRLKNTGIQEENLRTLESATAEQDYHYWLQQHDIADIARIKYGYGADTLFEIVGSPEHIVNQLQQFQNSVRGGEKRPLTLIVNLDNNHWVTLVISHQNGQYNGYYVDSLNNSIPGNIRQVLQQAQITINDISVTQQKDGYNCGLWALENARDINAVLQGGRSNIPNEIRNRLQGQGRDENYFIRMREDVSEALSIDPQRIANLDEAILAETQAPRKKFNLNSCVKPGGRSKRSVNSCLFSKDDVEKFSKGKVDENNVDKIIVDSEKFLTYVKNSQDEAKNAQLVEFVGDKNIEGDRKYLLDKVVGDQGYERYVQNERIKDLHGDISQQDSGLTKNPKLKGRLMTAAGGIQLIRGIHGAIVSCQDGVTTDCGLNLGGIGWSFASQPIENAMVKVTPKVLASVEKVVGKIPGVLGKQTKFAVQVAGVKFGSKIAGGAAGAITGVFDIVDIGMSANNLVDCKKRENSDNPCGEKEIRDNIATISFSTVSFVSGVALTALSMPGVGIAAGVALMVASGVYSGVSNIVEYEKKYDTTHGENWRIFWHTFAFQPIPEDVQHLAARKEIVNRLTKEAWKTLNDSSDNVVAYAFGLGRVSGNILSSSSAEIFMNKKDTAYTKNLSRVIPDNIEGASMICLPQITNQDYEKGITSSVPSAVYYCENAVVISRSNTNQANPTIIYDLQNVVDGRIIGSNEWNNNFLINKSNIEITGSNNVVTGGDNVVNKFVFLDTPSSSGKVIGGRNSTNILDLSEAKKDRNIRVAIQDNIVSGNLKVRINGRVLVNSVDPSNYYYVGRKRKMDEILCMGHSTHSTRHEVIVDSGGVDNSEKDVVENCKKVIILPYTTVKGGKSNCTFYVETGGYKGRDLRSEIVGGTGTIFFSEFDLLSDCDQITYSTSSNTLSLKINFGQNNQFTLDIKNYVEQSSNKPHFVLIDKNGSNIVPKVEKLDSSTIRINSFELHSEHSLDNFGNVETHYKKILKNNKDYKVLGVIRGKTQSQDNSVVPHIVFGSSGDDLIYFDQGTIFARGGKGSDVYVIADDINKKEVKIDNHSDDEKADTLFTPEVEKDFSVQQCDLHLNYSNTDIQVKNYFQDRNYRHLIIMNKKGEAFIPNVQSMSCSSSGKGKLVPFLQATQTQNIFLLPKDFADDHVVIDSRLEDIKKYKDKDDLLLIRESEIPFIIRMEGFYTDRSKWESISYSLWNNNDFVPSSGLLENVDNVMEYKDKLRNDYERIVKEYTEDFSDSTSIIQHNQKLEENISTSIRQDEERIGVMVLKNITPDQVEVSSSGTDLIFRDKRSNHKINIKGWESYRISKLEFDLGLEPIKILRLNRFSLSEVKEIQSLIDKASQNYQSREEYTSRVEDDFRCLISIHSLMKKPIYQCSGFFSLQDQANFVKSACNREQIEEFENKMPSTSQFMMLLEKLHNDLSLNGYNQDTIDKCSRVVTSGFGVLNLWINKAVDEDKWDEVQTLLDRTANRSNADVEHKSKCSKSWTLLNYFVYNGNVDLGKDIFKLILKKSGSIDALEDGNGWAALHYAVHYGDFNMASFLVDEGAKVDVKNKEGKTPLYLVIEEAKKNKLDMIKLLVERGADIEAKDNDGKSPLYLITYSGDLDTIKLLFEMIKAKDNSSLKTIKEIDSLRRKIFNQQNIPFYVRSFVDSYVSGVVQTVAKELRDNVSMHGCAAIVKFGDEIYEFNKELFKEIIREFISVVYGKTLNSDGILECINSYNHTEEKIYSYIALLDEMKRNDHLSDNAAFKLAYNVKEIIGSGEKYDLREIKNRLPGCVNDVVFPSKVCIKNVNFGEYLYPTDTKVTDDRRVVATDSISRATWKIEFKDGKFYIISNEGEYLYAADYAQYDDERRSVFTWVGGDQVKNDEWNIIPKGDICDLVNVGQREYLYSPVDYFKGKYSGGEMFPGLRPVFTWIGGSQVTNSEWKFEDCSRSRRKRDVEELESEVSLDSRPFQVVRGRENSNDTQFLELSARLQNNLLPSSHSDEGIVHWYSRPGNEDMLNKMMSSVLASVKGVIYPDQLNSRLDLDSCSKNNASSCPPLMRNIYNTINLDKKNIFTGKENVLEITSGYERLDIENFPVQEKVINVNRKRSLLDLSKLVKQVDVDLGIKPIPMIVKEKNDLLIKLSISATGLKKDVVTVRLKGALINNSYKNLQIVFDSAPVEIDNNLKLTPSILISDSKIIVVTPQNIEEGNKLIICREIEGYTFLHHKYDLIMTNALSANVSEKELYVMYFKDFYREPKMQKLSIRFIDKEILLSDKMDKIYHSDSIDKFNHVNSILDLEDRGTNIKANDFHDDTVLKVAYCIKEVIEKTSNKEEISSFERLKNKLPESVKNIVFSPTACIKNVRSDGYLYASSNKFRYNHERRVVSTQVGGRKNQQVFWKVDPSHGNSYIENVEFNECLHPPVNDMHSSEGRNIFTLIRRGGTQCNFWKFEPVGENVRIQDAQSGGYLYVPIHNSKHNNNGSNVGTERTKDEKSLWRFEDCRFIRNKRDIKQLESKVSLDSKTIKAKKRASGDQTSVLSEKLQRNVYLSRKPLAIDISSQPEIAASGSTRPSSWMNICISWAKNLATRTFSIIPGLPTQYSIADKNNVKNDNKNIPQTVGWNKFLNNENIALASCVADALDNIPSRRYQGLMSKGVEVVPSRRVAVDFALKKFNSFVEDKIRNLESKEQARIRVELKGAYPEIIASLERGVEFSGNVGLDNVLEKCKKCFCTNVLPKDKVSTCLSEIGVTKLGGNLNR